MSFPAEENISLQMNENRLDRRACPGFTLPPRRVILHSTVAEKGNKVRFGVFEVRLDTRELRRQGARIKLEDQPFLVLAALLEKPGAVVTRAELRTRIWPDGTFVDFDKSLTKAVNKIRTALHDSAAAPRFIETLSRRGYRFIAPVLPAGAPEQAVQEPAEPHRPFPRWWAPALAAGLLIGLLAAGGLLLRLRGPWASAGAMQPIRSLAVLPIVNLTGDVSQEYFVDGLTDDLISNLSRIGALRVISYTSMMRYKSAPKGVPEIARELGVEGVIEGSAQRAGARMRMNIKLVRAAAERQLWSESYEGEASDAPYLEGRIALAVAYQISAHLTAGAAARLAGGGSANPAAYEAYEHGRYLWNLRGRDAITEATRFFEDAVRGDPNFALAWSGLADCYTIGWEAHSDPFLAETYARKALALNPRLAEAHVSLGFAKLCQRRFAEAEPELRRGGELNPNYVPAHQLYAVHLLTLGRAAAALTESDRALELDPFSLPVNNMRAMILIGLHQYDAAEKYENIAAQLAPDSAEPANNLARIHWLQHRAPQALADHRRAAALAQAPGADAFLRGLADAETVFARSGFRAACLRTAQWRDQTQQAGGAWPVGLQYGLLEDRRRVLDWVGHEVDRTGYGGIYFLKTAPELDFIRADPAFQELLRRIGLPP